MAFQTPATHKPLGYNVALEKIRAEQHLLLCRAKWLRKYQKLINDVVRKAEKAVAASRYEDVKISVNTCGHEGAYVLMVDITLRGIPGFAHAGLQRLLEQFIDADETKTQDYAIYLNREYVFIWDVVDTDHRFRICVDAWVKSDSETCRRVLK